MKRTRSLRTLLLIGRACLLAVLVGRLSLFAADVAAQDPVPTPTPAPTWTPQPGATDTPSPGEPGVPSVPTPIPTATSELTNRVVDFRADDTEINTGDCVQFSWVVQGDVDRVEFDQDDDNKDPILVAALDSRQECPADDARYRLITRWLNGGKDERDIKIKVHTGGNGDDGGGDDGTGSGSAAPGQVGAFIPVTPILITTVTPQTQNSLFLDQQTGAPSGVLNNVRRLPETGQNVVVSPAAGMASLPPRIGGLIGATSGAVVGLLVLARLLRRPSGRY